MATLKRYRLTLLLIVIIAVYRFINPAIGTEMITRTLGNFREMLSVLPPIFILLGVLEVWVPREVIFRNLGEGSGLRGIALSVFLGAAAAGPLYVAFPVGVAMLRKGASFGNIAIFLFSWSTLKIPLILFETSALGWEVTLLRAAINLPAIIIMGLFLERLLPASEKAAVREKQIQLALMEEQNPKTAKMR